MAKKKTEVKEDYYVVTRSGIIAGLKIWPKRGKAGLDGKVDVEFKFGEIDGSSTSDTLLGRPMIFSDMETAKAFAGVVSCFDPSVTILTESQVREYLVLKAAQKEQRDGYEDRIEEKQRGKKQTA